MRRQFSSFILFPVGSVAYVLSLTTCIVFVCLFIVVFNDGISDHAVVFVLTRELTTTRCQPDTLSREIIILYPSPTLYVKHNVRYRPCLMKFN